MTVTLLDGGMGQELIARAGKSTSLWSVQALLDNPQWVRDVHDDYFAAGAQMATTNTYSILPDRLEHHDLAHRLEELQRLACQLAVDAREARGIDAMVVGSLGPQGFSYQPDLSPPAAQAAEVYQRICHVQQDYVDAFVAETMSSLDQIEGALMGTAGFNKPVWIAVSVDDNDGSKLRSGEPVTDIKNLVDQYKPAAVLVNCSLPEAVSVAVPLLTSIDVPIGAYANGFTGIDPNFSAIGATVDKLTKRTDLGPDEYLRFAQQWVEDGATLIGGCCEVGPAHIATLHKHLMA